MSNPKKSSIIFCVKLLASYKLSLCISTTGIKKCTTCAMSMNQNKLLQQLLLNNSLIFSNN